MALKASLVFLLAFILLASTMDAAYPPAECPPEAVPPYPPKKPLACAPLCISYCKPHPSHLHLRECERACSGCCNKYECVPTPTQKCPIWDFFIDKDGDRFTCP